ncbi:MAG: PadR family transcriptional regulator [Halobacteriales archaeon]
MAKWLQSGVRRDVCILLYGEDELRFEELKTRLQDHYGDRIRPERFRERVESLVDAGHVDRRVDGLHDVYCLTDDGRAALEAHVEWIDDQTGR